jgi:hypothetical protein
MRPVSKETYISVLSFMNKLNKEQVNEICNRMKIKQPAIEAYLAANILEIITEKETPAINFLFVFIIRCYDYEYGEMNLISEDATYEHFDELNEYTQRELKRYSKRKVTHSLSRDTYQRELVAFIDNFLEGDNPFVITFTSEDIVLIRMVIYCVLLLLNKEVEKTNKVL